MAVDTARGGGTASAPPKGTARPSGTADGTPPSGHGGCACTDCPHGVREGRRRALAEFRRRREELAAGVGVPAALAHSPGASRQWVSDELAQAARTVAEHTRAEAAFRLGGLWRRTAAAVWGAVALLLAGQGRRVSAGEAANLGLVDPAYRGTVDSARFASRSRNTPYQGRELPGRVTHTF
ncbi:hypothetical protein ACG5V6_26245, partial [Streptomyces chitinivorans]